MRRWDIVDSVEPNVTSGHPAGQKMRIRDGITSAVRTALLLGMAVGASGDMKITSTQQANVAGYGTVFRLETALRRPANAPKRSDAAASPTDTQHGQSTAKLAKSFAAFFTPAPDEPDNEEDDYRFA